MLYLQCWPAVAYIKKKRRCLGKINYISPMSRKLNYCHLMNRNDVAWCKSKGNLQPISFLVNKVFPLWFSARKVCMRPASLRARPAPNHDRNCLLTRRNGPQGAHVAIWLERSKRISTNRIPSFARPRSGTDWFCLLTGLGKLWSWKKQWQRPCSVSGRGRRLQPSMSSVFGWGKGNDGQC